MQTSSKGIALIKSFESLSLVPYLCPAGVPTIGWGNTIYPNGKKVTMKDKPITAVEAELIFHFILGLFERDVTRLVKSHVTATQFDALISFAYNVGTDIDADDIPEGLGDSTLLKRINANPNDLDIQNQFLKWNKSNGVASPGLTRRRKAEYHLYSTGELKLKF